MRRIYIKFTNSRFLESSVERDYGGKLVIRIRNKNGYQVILRDPILRRKLVGGVFILTDNGTIDKWLDDDTGGTGGTGGLADRW